MTCPPAQPRAPQVLFYFRFFCFAQGLQGGPRGREDYYFWWKDKNDNDASTQWSPFKDDTTYFEPSKKDFMFNYRVEDLETLIKTLREEGVTIVGDMQTYEYGKFAWILDNENNKIELWEPIDEAFK